MYTLNSNKISLYHCANVSHYFNKEDNIYKRKAQQISQKWGFIKRMPHFFDSQNLNRVYNYLFNYFAFVGTAFIEEKQIIFNPFLLHINYCIFKELY